MRFNTLRSVGHNIADSLASGLGIPIGGLLTDIYSEAEATPDGALEVDFLAGRITRGQGSDLLAKAVSLYRDACAHLCARHGVDIQDFSTLKATYRVEKGIPYFEVTLVTADGQRAVDSYTGMPGRRNVPVDHLGRLRPQTDGSDGNTD